MAPDSGLEDDSPLIEPWLFKVLKNRPRLIDRGYRRQACESMHDTLRERRKPDKAADRVSKTAASAAQEAGGSVARDVAEEPLRKAAQTRF